MPNRGKLHCGEDRSMFMQILFKETFNTTDLHLKNDPVPLTVSTEICYLLLLLYGILRGFCVYVHPVSYTLITWVCHAHRFDQSVAWSFEALV